MLARGLSMPSVVTRVRVHLATPPPRYKSDEKQNKTKTRETHALQVSRTTATLAMFPNGRTRPFAPFGSRPS